MRNNKTPWRPFSKKNKAEQDTKKSHVPFRLDFLFFIVFLLFTALVVRLSYLQINKHDEFAEIVEKGQKSIIEENAPRGYIYDAKGKVLVGNKANQAILFTRSTGMTAEEIKKISKQIVDLIAIEPEKLSERDKKDYILSDPKELKKAEGKLTVSDKLNTKGEQLSSSDLYKKTLDKVDVKDYEFTKEDEKIATVFKKINSAYALQPVTVKNKDVTPEEIAVVGENTATIPGLSAGTDWEREYPEKDQIRSILGTVSTEKQGLPEEKAEEYLKKGYKINDRVGLSYLEESYENDLKGKRGESEITTDKNQKITSKKEVKPGEKGDNLVLTIDLEFQKKVEEILESNYQSLINSGKAQYSDGAYVVVTEPSTGNVLSMVGLNKDPETGELVDDALGTYKKAYEPGSSIKAATIMSGYENGIISGNETMIDEPLVFEGGQTKSSLFNQYGSYPLTTVQALEVSSNVYMMKIALGMMDATYTPNMSLPFRTDVYNTLRKTYEEFGLGIPTEIDLPSEETGIVRTNYKDKNGNYLPGVMGNLLDLSFGNYDTYTPMQLNQYVATVANGGTRVAPHVVKGVYGNDNSGNLGEVKKEIKPKTLNKIEGKESEFDIIHQGMVQVVNGPMGTAHGAQGASLPIAAKTGTAETFAVNPTNNNVETVINSTIVGFAPYDNPQIAVSVVLPKIKDDKDATNVAILKQVVNAYAETHQ
ncbi:penicillin-binding transpeptidase domain-containing protein [Vagococcus hydrophili]|uniref:Penicillin-binding protein 2 n=1 Tax=Vagococcus hydrophili TaxID=2714947 RepID=A0A6G8AX82_9ENTE|nr:penicillin-binding transpeptidase domain-containing protein [Vagococcus hydrophili]QIL49569.1 penicillin-binding protein 2 [Vagococcus hydrophili]